ncbi:MAG: hypothetical protein WBO46_21945 [Caldilineaceae bacterium]
MPFSRAPAIAGPGQGGQPVKAGKLLASADAICGPSAFAQNPHFNDNKGGSKDYAKDSNKNAAEGRSLW